MKIYYAHSMEDYNTPSEEYVLEEFKKRYPDAEVINPNGLYSSNADWKQKWNIEKIWMEYDLVVGFPVMNNESPNYGWFSRGTFDEVRTNPKAGLFWINGKITNKVRQIGGFGPNYRKYIQLERVGFK